MPSRTSGAALRTQGSQPKGLPAKPRQPGREVEQAEPGKEGDFTTPLAERSADHRRGVDMTGCADVSRARHIDGCSVSSVNSGPVHQGQTGARFSLGKLERRNVGNAESAHLSGSKQALCRDRPSRPRGGPGVAQNSHGKRSLPVFPVVPGEAAAADLAGASPLRG